MNTMNIRFLVLFSLIISIMSLAQTKSLYLQIDTVDIRFKADILYDYKIEVDGGDIFQMIKAIEQTEINYSGDRYPNCKTIIPLFIDSNTIKLPIDNHSSHLVLENIYGLDTLHIEKIIVFDTQPLDTIYTSIWKYAINNGQFNDQAFEVTHRLYSNESKNKPTQSYIVVNNKKYKFTIDVTDTPVRERITGHGFHPKRYSRKNGQLKKNAYRFDTRESRYEYFWVGKVKLKE